MSCDSVLSCTGKPKPARVRAGRRFVELAERQQQALELRGRELRERVGLILRAGTAEEVRAVGSPFEPRVVPGRDVARAERSAYVRSVPSLTKLLHATHGLGVRPRGVVADEALDDVAPERFFEIEHVVRNAEHRRAATRVVEIVAPQQLFACAGLVGAYIFIVTPTTS